MAASAESRKMAKNCNMDFSHFSNQGDENIGEIWSRNFCFLEGTYLATESEGQMERIEEVISLLTQRIAVAIQRGNCMCLCDGVLHYIEDRKSVMIVHCI